ncbi:MAG: hypothetical protein S4CHLAM6_14000 [Chlamydiae bacterium]|nr:hypothetical protein [Chlamydiota bacterium]
MISKCFKNYFLNNILLLVLSFSYLHSGDATWNGGANPWADDASWNITSGVGFPNASTDDALFTSSGTPTISLPITLNSLTAGANDVELIQNGTGSLTFATTAGNSIEGSNITSSSISVILGDNSNVTIDTLGGAISFTSGSSLTGPSTASLLIDGGGSFVSNGVNLSGPTTIDNDTTFSSIRFGSGTHSGDVNISTANSIFIMQLEPGETPTELVDTYSGELTGIGSFFVTSSQPLVGDVTVLRLTGDSTNFAGSTDIFGGNLRVDGTLGGTSITTNDDISVVSGSGTHTGTLNADEGRIIPGSSSGNTLTVNTYNQGANASLNISITPTSTTTLNVTGTATLDGTLALNPGAGIYFVNDRYTVLTAGTIVDQFATFTETHPLDFQLIYNPTNVQIRVLGTTIVTPVALSDLRGNSKSVGDYMFSDPNVATYSDDSIEVTNAILANSPGGFEDSLIRVSPLASASIPVSTFQNDLQMAVVLDKQFQKKVNSKKRNKKKVNSKKRKNKEDTTLSYSIPKTGFFIEPIGVFYRQQQTEGALTNTAQVPFNSYTYGAGTGWEQVLAENFVVEGGVGYTHSNLHWFQNFGNSKWSTIYFAPFLGWFNEKAFVNFMAMGAINIIDTARKVSFGAIQRKARSHYLSYDLLLRLNGGARVPLGKVDWFNEKLSANLWFQPDATLNYLTIFTDGYKEKGAESLNLQIKRRTTYIMQPSFRGKIIQEFKTKKFCYSPIIYVGWLANIMLEKDSIPARFATAPNQIFFNIEGYSGTVNQLVLGTEFFIQKFDKFEFTGAFEVDMLSRFEVYTSKIKFQWLF